PTARIARVSGHRLSAGARPYDSAIPRTHHSASRCFASRSEAAAARPCSGERTAWSGGARAAHIAGTRVWGRRADRPTPTPRRRQTGPYRPPARPDARPAEGLPLEGWARTRGGRRPATRSASRPPVRTPRTDSRGDVGAYRVRRRSRATRPGTGVAALRPR